VAILRELGHREARCDVWEGNDREAKLLLATLNRLEGQDAPIRRAQLVHELLGEMNLADLAGLLPETEKQIEELHSLLEFPAEEIAALLDAEAEEAEKVLPRVMSFVVTPEQEEVIEQAVELASDGTPGRDRRARGISNLARIYLEGRENVRLEGRPFRFEGHEYLRAIYDDTSPHVVISKAAQVGGTTWALLRSIHAALSGLHIVYYFPTRSDVIDFSKSRVAPLPRVSRELAMPSFTFEACRARWG
jgi:hypothetical protein